MPLWGSNAQLVNNAPTHLSDQYRANTTNRAIFWQNTTPSAITNGQVVGVYAVTKTIVQAGEANAQHLTRFLSPGFYKYTQGMGPLKSLTISAGGSGYANTNLVLVTSNAGINTINASAAIVTNTTGGIVNLNITNTGLFVNTITTTLSVTNSTGGATGIGTGANITFTLGGRANRVKRENLVAVDKLSLAMNTAAFPLA